LAASGDGPALRAFQRHLMGDVAGAGFPRRPRQSIQTPENAARERDVHPFDGVVQQRRTATPKQVVSVAGSIATG
jgi:hypothetical protein